MLEIERMEEMKEGADGRTGMEEKFIAISWSKKKNINYTTMFHQVKLCSHIHFNYPAKGIIPEKRRKKKEKAGISFFRPVGNSERMRSEQWKTFRLQSEAL